METCNAHLAQDIRITAGEPSAVWEELAKLKIVVDMLWIQVTVGSTVTTPIVEILRLETYRGERKAREIENFLFGLKRYFNTLSIVGGDVRLWKVLLYFKDSALIRWR
mgnify:CR=1 FL=1